MKVSPVESDGALLDVAGTIVADDAPIVAQPLPEGLLDVQLCLVRRGGENHFIFEHASSIASGFIKPLTLSSHAGGIGRKGKEHVAGPWRYVRTGTVAADAAANVKYKEPHIILDKSDMVLEMALGTPGPGTDVNFVGHNEAQRMTATRGSGFKAYKGGGGKEWQINSDGSISPLGQSLYVLGHLDAAKIRADAHDAVRTRKKPVTESQATIYAKTLSKAQASAKGFDGCHVCSPFGLPHAASCGICFYGGLCSDDVVCAFPCLLGIPLPYCLHTWERQDQTWVLRESNGKVSGRLMIVDHERGTLACFMKDPCGPGGLDATSEAKCHCYKLFPGNNGRGQSFAEARRARQARLQAAPERP